MRLRRRLPRFFVASLAAARFRLRPSHDTAADAGTLAREAPWPWLQALVATWASELLRDKDAARNARERFMEIGAEHRVRRAVAVLHNLGVVSARPRSDGDPLTPREMEVAELVAEGLSNPTIARRLYLSRPTVSSHVAHILTKLDYSSRTQIATWVERHGAGVSDAPDVTATTGSGHIGRPIAVFSGMIEIVDAPTERVPTPEQLVEDYAVRVLRFATLLCRNRADAETSRRKPCSMERLVATQPIDQFAEDSESVAVRRLADEELVDHVRCFTGMRG